MKGLILQKKTHTFVSVSHDNVPFMNYYVICLRALSYLPICPLVLALHDNVLLMNYVILFRALLYLQICPLVSVSHDNVPLIN